jgi:hypothetical protein
LQRLLFLKGAWGRHEGFFLGSGRVPAKTAAIACGAFNAGAVHRAAPIAEVELDALLLGLDGVVARDGRAVRSRRLEAMTAARRGVILLRAWSLQSSPRE